MTGQHGKLPTIEPLERSAMGIRGLIIAAVLAGAAGSSAAQGDREATARALFNEATTHFDNGELSLALEKYRATYRLVPRPKVLLNIGAVLFELDRRAEAANTFDRYLRDEGADPQRIERVRDTLGDLDKELARLELSIQDPGLAVSIDGAIIARSPVERAHRVEPGRHTIAITAADGGERFSQSMELAAGASRRVLLPEAELEPAEPTVVSAAPESSRDLRLFVRTDVDLALRGAVLAPGASLQIRGPIHLFASGVLGRSSGFELGMRLWLGSGRIRPVATVSVPVFFREGARPAGRASLGAAWARSQLFLFYAELGAAYAPSVPLGYVSTSFLASLGIEVNLL